MEVVNSGAVQSDVLQLFHDWMSLLNRGYRVTPIGSSDSHDVARHFIGQGRTYIRGDDRDPGKIDEAQAIESLLGGHVMVSYGLLAEMTIGGRYGAGDLVPVGRAGGGERSDELSIDLRVLGPRWTHVKRVRWYANGTLIREDQIPEQDEANLPLGIRWQGNLKMSMPRHDIHLVAIAVPAEFTGMAAAGDRLQRRVVDRCRWRRQTHGGSRLRGRGMRRC
jgi:hypothetical protein